MSVTMKKILSLLSVLLLTIGCYDDSEILNELRNHEERLAKLETLCKQMNTNITALQTVVSALENKIYVTAVIPIKEGGDIVGYTIAFNNSESVTIYNGKDGEDGTDGSDGIAPSIGVRQDTDEIYYWTLNGEWLLDADGKKVQAIGRDGTDGSTGGNGADGNDGQDGVDGTDGSTPQLKTENGYWYVSYDGKNWTQLGKATGESANLIGITQDENNVYFTLTDGTVITLPKGNGGSQEGEEGDDGSQTISKGPIKLSLGEVTATTATFTARLDVDMMGDYLEVGLIYSKDDNMDVENTAVTKVKINKVSYSETFTGLSYDTDYYYTVYLLSNNVYSYGETQSFKTEELNVTVAVDNITQTAAKFIGNVELQESDVVEVGLLYSSSASDPKATTTGVGKVVLTDRMDADGNYSCRVEGLLNETTHYYRYYVKHGTTYTYGDVLNFKTEKVPVTIEVESIDRNVVTFKGNAQFSEPGVIRIDICYSASLPESLAVITSQRKTVTEISENGDFTVVISGLFNNTKYYWYYDLVQNNAGNSSFLQTFATTDMYKVQSDLSISSAVDLSSSEPANCYIVSEAGLYKFRTVKGNGNESVGDIASASILWETFGTSTIPNPFDLISAICYSDGYIAFQTADQYKEGNAVIAAKDASGSILWSWHIWFTDQPQGQVYYNNAGIMMDRNLGATSATPGDVGALGLLYQWGRKDPFLGASSIHDEDEAKSTIVWPSVVSSTSSTGTIDYATAHPTTFITCDSDNYDWYYTGSPSTDNSRWTTSDSYKSIYDPCPAGWRIPDGGSEGVWSKAGFYYTTYDRTTNGMLFSISSPSTTWYPASNCRAYDW